ncbi:MAG: hypothetical protein ACI8Z1_002292 [Candidatus Azotimanducaceae bacterium]|jgi:hypothetical protein
MERRKFLAQSLTGIGAFAAGSMVSNAVFADNAANIDVNSSANQAREALVESDLIYLSPIKAGGNLSRCQAEVWFVMLGANAYVITRRDSWRARAPRLGVDQTKIWVGDLGVWKRANYQALPTLNATASQVAEQDVTNAVLEQLSVKYASEWRKWGPRFRNGLADGSRVVLRYQLS